ncbi:hypothetical protein FOCC_FOCC015989 [Frankliniella occidentalis]|nr:hypothetical protein FOCC_FOCC015989 [Frankliniella occidentalis]
MEEGHVNRRPGRGRPRCTSAREDGATSNAATNNPRTTARQVASDHHAATHHVISESTRGEQEWRRVLFSDEVRFILHKSDGRLRQGEGPALSGENGPQRWLPHVLGWHVGTPPSVGVPATSRRRPVWRYIDEVLDPHVIQLQNEAGADFIFQQDNARPHSARNMLNFLEGAGVTLLKHPANSPDLNPIENLWDEVDRGVRKMSPQPRTMRAAVLAA